MTRCRVESSFSTSKTLRDLRWRNLSQQTIDPWGCCCWCICRMSWAWTVDFRPSSVFLLNPLTFNSFSSTGLCSLPDTPLFMIPLPSRAWWLVSLNPFCLLAWAFIRIEACRQSESERLSTWRCSFPVSKIPLQSAEQWHITPSGVQEPKGTLQLGQVETTRGAVEVKQKVHTNYCGGMETDSLRILNPTRSLEIQWLLAPWKNYCTLKD